MPGPTGARINSLRRRGNGSSWRRSFLNSRGSETARLKARAPSRRRAKAPAVGEHEGFSRRSAKASAERLIRVFVVRALLGRSAELVERAIRTPGLGVEPRGAGDWQHIAMAAALGAVFGGTPPATRLEACDSRRQFPGRFGCSWRRRRRERVRHATDLILNERRRSFLAHRDREARQERRA